MLCYVGKATKIFIFIIVLLAVLGLVLGFTVFRRKTHKCDGRACGPPDYVHPISAPTVLSPPTTPTPPATPTPLVEAAPSPPYSDRPVETSPPPYKPPDTPPAQVVEASPPPYQPPAPPATLFQVRRPTR